MKKKNLNHKGLNLRKNVVSNLDSENAKGGRTLSCLADANTNCATVNCGTANCLPQTVNCPPQSQQGCTTALFPCQTASCPGAGIC
ncbi:MAG: hypothetical protein AAF611_00995 [Bacteroidota bacterium]